KRGRPRVDLAIRGQAHLVAGVKVAHDTLSIALMDFAGELIGEYETPLSASVLSSADMAGELRIALEAALDKYAMPYSRLSGVGIGLAGFIDASRGFVHWSPSLTERNIPLQDIISEKIEVPVFIDNDANLVAVAEQYFGRGTEHTDFIVVTIESGVGMGIVLNGQLYRGDRGCGAEFGHTKVQLDGAMCRCGQRGCLEAYVADYAIEREAAISAPHIEENDRRVATVLQAAKDGDEAALKIVNRAGRMFAMGLANLVNVFDPQLIILAGERMQFDHLFEESVFEDVRRQVVHVDLPPPEIVTHKWGDLMWAKGAAAYAIDQVAERSLREIGENAG
ncbi:MAG: ROK family protein, partial [Pseudomonadota bacterium]|nr:ROK family protein [Pseudomonadota bacterium]